jgi:hypothetical protein
MLLENGPPLFSAACQATGMLTAEDDDERNAIADGLNELFRGRSSLELS